MLPSDKYLDIQTKKRYYKFFKRHIPEFQICDTDGEMKAFVLTAITWLISQTRDREKFPLIEEENINFGFSYNLLGLRPYGISMSTLGILLNVFMAVLLHKGFVEIKIEILVVGIIMNVLFLALWILIVNKKLVISCGRKYARALLAACDSPYFD